MMWRSLIITLFSAILALTSVTLAVAQHGTAGGTTLILCTSTGAQTVTLDANGNPVPAAHPCPDCVAAIAAQGVPPAAQLPLRPLTASAQFAQTVEISAPSRAAPPAQARAPPLIDVI